MDPSTYQTYAAFSSTYSYQRQSRGATLFLPGDSQKLAILEITATSRYQGDQQGFALEDAAAFIDAHAATLEEISVRGPERISMGERWRTLPRLAEYHFHSIEDLAAELPDLESRWAKGHNSLSILPRIRVVFDDIFIAKGSITTIAASFRQYPTTVARLDGSIATTWKDLEIRIADPLGGL
ncbi:hypothetical protein PIIN_00556 [Serendipita indica DSM 11827]|uniref:Uncharacterized protein n=1 Tax=Serendipita indica (strain DSM 11827) TaxID=1109443 RepID=G4U2S1_SERID|nr:hypothetical protein PIIN_00556 [Serendipita indica DSM 11827]